MSTILVINPGSTSTKLAIFAEHRQLAETTLRHPAADLAQFDSVLSQKAFRKQLILNFLAAQDVTSQLVAIVGRGGLLKPVVGGTYQVDQAMLADLNGEKYGTHASNLGGILAAELGHEFGVPAFIVDPVVVDELTPLARVTGLKGLERRSVSHVLNQKAVARKVLAEQGLPYEKGRVIVAHLGGGISVGAHQKGQMIDVTNGLDGEGPYSPERTGALPLGEFAQYILEEKLTLAEVKRLVGSQGGLKSYLAEGDVRQLTAQSAAGGETEGYYLAAMGYQISKAIGEMATVLAGKVDRIILTGGVAHAEVLVNQIKEAVDWIAPVAVVPGEMEMEALYEGCLRVLTGKEPALNYAQTEVSKVGVE